MPLTAGRVRFAIGGDGVDDEDDDAERGGSKHDAGADSDGSGSGQEPEAWKSRTKRKADHLPTEVPSPLPLSLIGLVVPVSSSIQTLREQMPGLRPQQKQRLKSLASWTAALLRLEPRHQAWLKPHSRHWHQPQT